jgi:hypothetical protein
MKVLQKNRYLERAYAAGIARNRDRNVAKVAAKMLSLTAKSVLFERSA